MEKHRAIERYLACVSKLPDFENGNFTVTSIAWWMNDAIRASQQHSITSAGFRGSTSSLNIKQASPVTGRATAQAIADLINGNDDANNMVIAIIAGGNGANGDGCERDSSLLLEL